MTATATIEHCDTHNCARDDCDGDRRDPGVLGTCSYTPMDLTDHLVRMAVARRDQLADRADDRTAWGDPEIGREFVDHVRAITVWRVRDGQIAARCRTHRCWNYAAGDVLDLAVPGYDNAAIKADATPNVYLLTWTDQ